jgi:hypothetical protein
MQEKRNIQYTRQKHQLPLKPSYMDGKHQSPPQISKSRRIKRFGENVDQLSLGVYIPHLNVPLLYMISQKVVSPLNMSHLFVEDWIFRYRDDTGVIAHEGALSKLTPESLMVCTIQGTCEQQLHTWPRWWTMQLKTISERISTREKIKENGKSQKCSFGQSHNPQNQHRRNQQDPAKKQNTKSQTQECV